MPSPEPKPETDPTQVRSEPDAKHNIVIYTTPTCPFCTLAKNYLASKGLSFREVDVSVEREKAGEIVEKSGQTSVPVIEVNGSIIVGFDKKGIDIALARGRSLTRDEILNNFFFDPFGR